VITLNFMVSGDWRLLSRKKKQLLSLFSYCYLFLSVPKWPQSTKVILICIFILALLLTTFSSSWYPLTVITVNVIKCLLLSYFTDLKTVCYYIKITNYCYHLLNVISAPKWSHKAPFFPLYISSKHQKMFISLDTKKY
jgi:hypothetical protein